MKIRLLFLFFTCYACRNGLKSQNKDTTVFKDTWVLINCPVSRTGSIFDIGVERIRPISERLSYAMQFSIIGGKWVWNLPESVNNPRFVSVCVQPFHLLAGKKRLKFETGLAFNLQAYRTSGKQYPAIKSFAFFQDAFMIIYSIGLRYTFKKPQLSLKIILGPRYGINLQTQFSQFIDSQSAEIGLSWKLRKKIKKYQPGKM